MAEANERIMSVVALMLRREPGRRRPGPPFRENVLSPNPQSLFRPLRHGPFSLMGPESGEDTRGTPQNPWEHLAADKFKFQDIFRDSECESYRPVPHGGQNSILP
jgi:hypothetical protein